jgi:hypothetical protein
MTAVELNAYLMTLRNGTLSQVGKAICDIVELENDVPVELLTAVLSEIRRRGRMSGDELARPIHKLIGKTQSIDLYRTADECGLLELGYFANKVCASGKVNLFVTEQFNHPELEPLVLDELHQWVNYLDQTIRQNYMDDLSPIIREVPEYDNQLKRSALFMSPQYPTARILQTLAAIGTDQARPSLLALEYLFRPRLNDYCIIEQKWLQNGDERAIRPPDEAPEAEQCLSWILSAASVYHLKTIMDNMATLARGERSVIANWR